MLASASVGAARTAREASSSTCCSIATSRSNSSFSVFAMSAPLG
jgi:hypothetical protein